MILTAMPKWSHQGAKMHKNAPLSRANFFLPFHEKHVLFNKNVYSSANWWKCWKKENFWGNGFWKWINFRHWTSQWNSIVVNWCTVLVSTCGLPFYCQWEFFLCTERKSLIFAFGRRLYKPGEIMLLLQLMQFTLKFSSGHYRSSRRTIGCLKNWFKEREVRESHA